MTETAPKLKSTMREARTVSPLLKSTFGETAMSSEVAFTEPAIRGLDAEKAKFMLPPGYKIPEKVWARIGRSIDNPKHTPFEDPEGTVKPWDVLESKEDPDHRRIVFCLYRDERDQELVGVYVEGSASTTNRYLTDIHQKIVDGALTVVPPPAE